MSNARKGPSGSDIKVVTVQVGADVITLSPAGLRTIDVLRIDVIAPGTHSIHGMAAGRNGQKIKILAAPDTGAGDFSLLNESGSALAGTEWFFGGTLNALIPPTNLEATYDESSGMWWITSTVED